MIQTATGPSRLVRQWQRLTWLRAGHACQVLRLTTPGGVPVEIYTTTGTDGLQRVCAATPGGVRTLDESVNLAALVIMIESLPGSSYEEE